MAFVYKEERKLFPTTCSDQLEHITQDQLWMLEKIILKQLPQQNKIGNLHSIIPHNLLRKIRHQFFNSRQPQTAQQQKIIKPLPKIEYTPISQMHPKIRKHLRNFSEENLQRLKKMIEETEQTQHEVPEVKSTFTNKTLVQYRQSDIKKEKQQKQWDDIPGPGEYDPKIQQNVKGVLPFQNNRCSKLVVEQEQAQQDQKTLQQHSFLPNYKTCVSPNFRQKVSNKDYLTGIANLYFRKSSNKDDILENQSDQIQYIRKTVSPGPGTYNLEEKIKYQSYHKVSSPTKCIFPNIFQIKRQQKMNLIGPESSMQSQKNNLKPVFVLKKTALPPFMSSIEKFTKTKTESNQILQNTDYTKSMLEKINPFSKGKFGSNKKRFNYQDNQDNSPQKNKKNKSENTKQRKKILKGPILHLKESRNPFWLINTETINTENYQQQRDTTQKINQKVNISMKNIKKKAHKLGKQNKQQAKIILTNPSLLNKLNQIQSFKKNIHSIYNFRSKLKKHEFKIVENQIMEHHNHYPAQFYNNLVPWETNSFNKNFSSKCLTKNNPILK